jgi:hypothetical protein
MNRLLADLILLIHALFVAFVIIGFVLILVGFVRKWLWIRNVWFRVIHLIAIGLVVVQAWLGSSCPLTTWESQLRLASGEIGYSSSFVQHGVQHILFYDFAPWIFVMAYTIFAVLVALFWALVPPRCVK